MSAAQLWTKRINIHTLFVNTTVTAVTEICFALLCNVYVIMLKSEVGNILVGELQLFVFLIPVICQKCVFS